MADAWHYADESGQVGPLTLRELEETLGTIRNPGDALVWRAGFPNWMPVREVAELSRYATPQRVTSRANSTPVIPERDVGSETEKVLLVVQGSLLLSNSWKQELVITNQAVYGEVLKSLRRIKMSLPYDRIAQINIVRGVLSADVEVVNKGGSDNLMVRAIRKSDAEAAKTLIEQRINSTTMISGAKSISVADELKKLAELRRQGVLTDNEFQQQKSRLLS